MSRVIPEAAEFQDDLSRIAVEPAPLVLRLWPHLAGLLLVALVTAAALLRVDVVVIAQGRLAADAPPAVLKPVAPAILSELRVRPGDVVAEGDLLARLDPTMADADRAALAADRAALAAEVARLEAELEGRLLVLEGPDGALQSRVQAERAALADTRRRDMQARVAALTDALAAEVDEAPGLAERLAVAREVEAMRVELSQRRSGSHLAVLEARVWRLEAEARERAHHARLAELEAERAAAAAALSAFDQNLRRERLEALAHLRPRLEVAEEQLSKAVEIAQRADLRAPHAGVVLSVAAGGPGSLLGAADPVVTLAPIGATLIAEVGLRSADVGRVAPGDPVVLKIDAYPWRRHGMLEGRLADVAPASVTPQGSAEALHAGRVRIAKAETSDDEMPSSQLSGHLMPGMTLTAEVHTGERSLLDFFLDPLLRGLGESLREP